MKRYTDLVSGGILVVVSIIMLVQTSNIQALGIMKFGPKVMPRIFSVALLIVGCVIVLYGFRDLHRAGARSPSSDVKTDRIDTRKVLLTATLICLYIFALEPIGFIVMTGGYLFLQFLVLGGVRKRRVPVYALLSVIVTAGIYSLFYGVFDVFLPPGILY